jgi:acetyltransferase-like isoleucine patch superfamily enzyme
MRHFLNAIVRFAKRDPSFDVDPELSFRAIIVIMCSATASVIRGAMRAPFFRSTNGFVMIKKRAILKHTDHLSVGRSFIAEEGCEINALSKRGVVFGDRVTVGAYAIIRASNAYGGSVGEGLKVGNNSNIGPFSYIGCSGYIEIGENVLMGPRVSVYAENHIYSRTDIPIKLQGVVREVVRIEDDCWISSNAVILAGVTIGRGSIVSAGSVVTKDVPPFSIVAGIPARVIRSRPK